ncbi:MAG TPA: ABC transporter substrate-binding protein [Gammaproteobacteria bacterium]|nr:ABC transporter substrate-binding protein [Gammaproteobacteria bacterium]
MSRPSILLLSFAVAFVTGIAPAHAGTPTPDAGKALIATTIEAVRSALSADPALARGERPEEVVAIVEELVLPHVDTQMSGRLILGRHWREASEAQREEFIAGYRDLLLRTYAVHVTDYLSADVAVLSAAPAGREGRVLQVRTRVTRPGKPVAAVDYRMIARGGEWKVFDAVVQGVSLVSTLRTAVTAEIQRVGIDGLNAKLQAAATDPSLVPVPRPVAH